MYKMNLLSDFRNIKKEWGRGVYRDHGDVRMHLVALCFGFAVAGPH